jgi:signal transduction histidine kinase
MLMQVQARPVRTGSTGFAVRLRALRIRETEFVTTIVTALTIVLVSLSLASNLRRAESAEDQHEISSRILNLVLEQRALVLEYAASHDERIAARWRAVHDEIEGLTTALTWESSEESELIALLKKGSLHGEQAFSALEASHRETAGEADASGRFAPLESLARTAQWKADAARRLQTLSLERERAARAIAVQTTTASLLLFGLVSFAGLAFTTLRVVRPLQKLQEGAALMGAGKLEHRTQLGTADEIGELSQSLDTMAVRLQEKIAESDRVSARLREVNADLEGFSHAVAHDLRAPLQAIDTYSARVLETERDRLSPQGLRYLERTHSAAGKMNGLIAALLEMAQTGRAAIRWETIDMGALLQECLEALEDRFEGRRVEVTVGPLPPCRGDRLLLKQVWTNLLENAVKYTGGRDVARICIRGAESGPFSSYEIEDNGAGFDMQYAGKLFRLFQRLHTEAEFPGTGVGLALVGRILQRHGGTISAHSEPGGGATFTVRLPRD